MSRIQRYDDGLEVEIHPGREELAARVVAEREAVVGKALDLMSLYLRLDRRGFHLDTIAVPRDGEAELSFSWSSAAEPEAEGYTRFDVFVSADLRPVGFAVRFV
ncbi:hypothetical protein [Actinomycetospora sp. NBRC 106378]|uniref:hypothetical protein n=1 Tax=Actinomycetospora sp. NBRC 106378 TaxID=3032208 RepID=UPI0024A5A2C3|nr:hypothetical protein [Actinomycetospora sp. NBRC 106378]GLZ52795.1 hypothetical protein Acsp07_24120 [Actinomycetospora sp. NBRC 106378]